MNNQNEIDVDGISERVRMWRFPKNTFLAVTNRYHALSAIVNQMHHGPKQRIDGKQ